MVKLLEIPTHTNSQATLDQGPLAALRQPRQPSKTATTVTAIKDATVMTFCMMATTVSHNAKSIEKTQRKHTAGC